MANQGRKKSPYEDMGKHPGFKCTEDQQAWLERAALKVRAENVGAWLRELAIKAGQEILGEKYPPKKLRQDDVNNPPPRGRRRNNGIDMGHRRKK